MKKSNVNNKRKDELEGLFDDYISDKETKAERKKRRAYKCETWRKYGYHLPLGDPMCDGCYEEEIKRLMEKD